MKARGREAAMGVDRRRVVLRGVCAVVLVCLVLAGAYALGRALERAGEPPPVRGDLAGRFTPPPRVTYEGEEYSPRAHLTTLLLQGIDQPAPGTPGTGYRNGGQADFLLLLVLDHDAKRVSALQIDRDTMAQITTLGVLGQVSGTRTAQICLAHGFGDGGAQSAGYTVDAVRALLLGAPIDFYIAMRLDGIGTLNDALGGVTVTLADDFTALDPAMARGATLTLRGEQAAHYTRQRLGIGLGTNAARMQRQQDYLHRAGALLTAAVQDSGQFAGTLLDTLAPYLHTDIPRGRLVNEAWLTRAYARADIAQLAGTHVSGADGYIEFHADPHALTRTVLALFYDRVEDD